MKYKLDQYEAQEIADQLLKVENPDLDYEITENNLAEQWNIDFDTFYEIVSKVFEMIDFGISPLTNTPMVGISSGNMWLAKKEVDQQFIHAVIQWCTEGTKIPKKSKGYCRTITSGGKPEYEITISLPQPEETLKKKVSKKVSKN